SGPPQEVLTADRLREVFGVDAELDRDRFGNLTLAYRGVGRPDRAEGEVERLPGEERRPHPRSAATVRDTFRADIGRGTSWERTSGRARLPSRRRHGTPSDRTARSMVVFTKRGAARIAEGGGTR